MWNLVDIFLVIPKKLGKKVVFSLLRLTHSLALYTEAIFNWAHVKTRLSNKHMFV